MHIELAPSRREAVAGSGSRPAVGRSGREPRPGHGGGVERVQVVEFCGRRVQAREEAGTAASLLFEFTRFA